jgi:TolA-binding protein
VLVNYPGLFRYLFTVSVLVFCAWATEETDYERALDAYEQGDYVISRMYFQNILSDNKYRQLHPDAVYYLTKIHDHEGDFLSFFSKASNFLEEYPYDMRASEIFRVLIEKLVARQSHVIAVDCLGEYDYLTSDDSLFGKLGHGLLKQGENVLADSVFSLCTQSDTIKIMRALLNNDYLERERIFKTLEAPSRNLYLAENYLLLGDTVSAYFNFREIDYGDLRGGTLFRYTKIALHFDRAIAKACVERLRRSEQYANKAGLLQSFVDCRMTERIIPEDEEELALYLRVCSLDTIAKETPEGFMFDSLLREADDTLALMQNLRRQYKNDYYIDSLYCQLLIRLGRFDDASRVISHYLKYCNAKNYVRKILGIQSFVDEDYRNAAKHIIISNYYTPFVRYMLAECFRLMGYDAGSLYEAVISQTTDSALYHNALAGFVQDRYAAEDFQSVCKIDLDELQGEKSLIKIYTRSLARCGSIESADSVYYAYFLEPDPLLLNHYGLYLIEKKEFTAAGAYFDSLIQSIGVVDDDLYYNWALTSFLNNDMEVARQRFTSYVADYPRGSRMNDAFFKIATLNYLQENYDSAAHYYGLASEGDALMTDALRNQLISHKKAGDWFSVISVGQKILASDVESEKADILFDVGYAFLRAGRITEAVENLGAASRLRSDPRFYYWLGEAYLSKGDFARSFYSYRKVLDLHGDDEMWVPTAQYKSGIVLELMDETEAARAVYEQIVRERGTQDPIGAEADIRLKGIEP